MNIIAIFLYNRLAISSSIIFVARSISDASVSTSSVSVHRIRWAIPCHITASNGSLKVVDRSGTKGVYVEPILMGSFLSFLRVGSAGFEGGRERFINPHVPNNNMFNAADII
jgi:hypothetical protein